MASTKMLIGLTAISAGLRQFKGIVSNAYDRAQILAVSIINHDLNGGKDGSPSGDCSKAKDLVNLLKTQEDKRNMIAFLGYFGNISFKMVSGTCTEVQHFKPDSKRYRKPDLEGANANNWYEPYLPNGDKAYWFEGPAKQLYVQGTIGGLGDNIVNFTDRFLGTDRRTGQLYDKIDRGDGTMIERYNLTKDERETVEKVMAGLRNIGYMLGAREEQEQTVARVHELQDFINQTTKVVDDLAKLGQTEAPQEVVNG